MISVRPIQIDEGELFKRMRLTALSESPSAFASTYKAGTVSQSRKLERAGEWHGPAAVVVFRSNGDILDQFTGAVQFGSRKGSAEGSVGKGGTGIYGAVTPHNQGLSQHTPLNFNIRQERK